MLAGPNMAAQDIPNQRSMIMPSAHCPLHTNSQYAPTKPTTLGPSKLGTLSYRKRTETLTLSIFTTPLLNIVAAEKHAGSGD